MHVFRLKDNQCEFNRLERLVNKNLRTALGFRQSNPINILIAEVKKAPLDLRFSFLLSTFMIRCLPQKQTLVLNSFNYLEMVANLSAKRKQALVSIFCLRHYVLQKDSKERMHRSRRPAIYAYTASKTHLLHSILTTKSVVCGDIYCH